MEVHFTPEVEAKLEQIARESGCRSDELVVDAVRCHIDGLAYVREMLDRRYDDLESGRVKPIDGAGWRKPTPSAAARHEPVRAPSGSVQRSR